MLLESPLTAKIPVTFITVEVVNWRVLVLSESVLTAKAPITFITVEVIN